MFKKDFQSILNDEMEFYGKRFTSDDEVDRKQQYIRFIERYYESLYHLKESELNNAFKKCREHYEYFPKINQLLKFCSPRRKEEKMEIPKYVDPAPEVKEKIKSVISRSRYKVGEKQLRENLSHCIKKWPMSNWDGVLERWLAEDELREDRVK